MKINRTAKVLAVILAIAMLPLGLIACGVDSTVSERLTDLILGDGDLKPKKYETTQEYIEQLDAKVEELSISINKQGYWADAYIEEGTTVIAQNYKNMYILAQAWGTKGSAYYHDSSILSKVKKALEYGYENSYGIEQLSSSDKNYSVSERCDVAEYLVRTLLILSENGKIGNSAVKKHVEVIQAKFPAPFGEGVDLARTAYIVLAYSALIGDTEAIERTISTYLVNAIGTVNSGNGLYTDGSFFASNEVASSGSYGVIAFSELVEIAYAVNDTKVDFAEELGVINFLYNWAVNSILPSLYNGKAFSGTTSSYAYEAEYLGGRAVSSLFALSTIVDDEKEAHLLSVIKGYGEDTGATFHRYLTSYGACRYQDLSNNKKIEPAYIYGAFNFAYNDKLNVIGTKFSASLSISSLRSAKYETRAVYTEQLIENLGAVNGNGWYTGDGMLMLYTSDYSPSESYWKYVNGHKIPGTTVDLRERESLNAGGFDGINSNSGSVTLGSFAVSAYDFVNNNSEIRSDLSAKKSWFFFDNEIVALGSGIRNSYIDKKAVDQTIATIVENVFYGKYQSIYTSAEQKDDKTLSKDKPELIPEAIYAAKYGGIYCPKDKNDALYASLNVTEGGNFVEFWFDHGILATLDAKGNSVSDKVASYEYAIVPSTAMNAKDFFGYDVKDANGNTTRVQGYVEKPGYTVLSNTEKVQAVFDESTKTTGYTFWEGATCNGITTDFACTIMIQETETGYIVAVSDFTHYGAGNRDGGTITLNISGTVVSADAGLTFSGSTITIDRTVAAAGQTMTLVINK